MPEFTPIAKYNVGITAGIENTAPKAEWIQGMNRMNMNIVPSKFVKEIAMLGGNIDNFVTKSTNKAIKMKI